MSELNEKDYIVRAMAANEQIRAFAVTSKNLVEEARRIHSTSPVATAALGRLLSAGAMMGSMLKGDKDLLTLSIHSDGPMRGLCVTADSKGCVKGYPNVNSVIIPAKPNGKLDVSGALGNGILRVVKDMGLKEPYIGQIALQTGEIAEDLTYYFATSEQVPSAVGLGVLMNKDNTVRCAGGFIIQLMPFAEDKVIEKLEENLAKCKSVTAILDEGKSPEEMLEIILDGFDVTISDTMDAKYFCNCTKDRVERALISIGAKELKSMINEGKTIEMNCNFCDKKYNFTVEELKKLLKDAR